MKSAANETADQRAMDREYAGLILSLRGFLDSLAGADPDNRATAALRASLERWTDELGGSQVSEQHQVLGRRAELAGRGQTLAPAYREDVRDTSAFSGKVNFGRYFLGRGGAVFGGAIAALFDEQLGKLGLSLGAVGVRTAFLHVNYRSLTPVGVDLVLKGRIVSHEGRKIMVSGELLAGDSVCADAECLLIEARP